VISAHRTNRAFDLRFPPRRRVRRRYKKNVPGRYSFKIANPLGFALMLRPGTLKPEFRSPKAEPSPKAEARRPCAPAGRKMPRWRRPLVSASEFGLGSAFDFRTSEFGLKHHVPHMTREHPAFRCSGFPQSELKKSGTAAPLCLDSYSPHPAHTMIVSGAMRGDYGPVRARKKRALLVAACGATARNWLPGLLVVSKVCHGPVATLVRYSTVTVGTLEERTSKLKAPAA
jgi:hypothetical protein